MLKVLIFLDPLLAIGQQKKTLADKGKGLAKHVKPSDHANKADG